MCELKVVHYGLFGPISLIIHKEFKLRALCLIVCCVGGVTWLSSGTNEICLYIFCLHLMRYLDTIILAITSTLMTHNSIFHLNVRILWDL